jgi:uncharacterized repeat protein (TIGR03833 family)
VVCANVGAAQSSASAQKIWYRQPAARWEEALPIGNGRLDAMVFGGVAVERLQLNEDTIWTGEKRDRNNPNGAKAVLAREVGLRGRRRTKRSHSFENRYMNGQNRNDIRPGMTVDIVLKQDQRTGRRTRGIVRDILTKSPHHPHGIKVRLEDGQVGRVQEICDWSSNHAHSKCA